MELVASLVGRRDADDDADADGDAAEPATSPAPQTAAKASDSPDPQAGDSWMQSLVLKALFNAGLTVTNVVIKLEAARAVASVSLRRLELASAGAAWEPAFIEPEGPSALLRKRLRVAELTVCLDPSEADGRAARFLQPLVRRASVEARVESHLHPSERPDGAATLLVDLYSDGLTLALADEHLALLSQLVDCPRRLRRPRDGAVDTPPASPAAAQSDEADAAAAAGAVEGADGRGGRGSRRTGGAPAVAAPAAAAPAHEDAVVAFAAPRAGVLRRAAGYAYWLLTEEADDGEGGGEGDDVLRLPFELSAVAALPSPSSSAAPRSRCSPARRGPPPPPPPPPPPLPPTLLPSRPPRPPRCPPRCRCRRRPCPTMRRPTPLAPRQRHRATVNCSRCPSRPAAKPSPPVVTATASGSAGAARRSAPTVVGVLSVLGLLLETHLADDGGALSMNRLALRAASLALYRSDVRDARGPLLCTRAHALGHAPRVDLLVAHYAERRRALDMLPHLQPMAEEIPGVVTLLVSRAAPAGASPDSGALHTTIVAPPLVAALELPFVSRLGSFFGGLAHHLPSPRSSFVADLAAVSDEVSPRLLRRRSTSGDSFDRVASLPHRPRQGRTSFVDADSSGHSSGREEEGQDAAAARDEELRAPLLRVRLAPLQLYLAPLRPLPRAEMAPSPLPDAERAAADASDASWGLSQLAAPPPLLLPSPAFALVSSGGALRWVPGRRQSLEAHVDSLRLAILHAPPPAASVGLLADDADDADAALATRGADAAANGDENHRASPKPPPLPPPSTRIWASTVFSVVLSTPGARAARARGGPSAPPAERCAARRSLRYPRRSQRRHPRRAAAPAARRAADAIAQWRQRALRAHPLPERHSAPHRRRRRVGRAPPAALCSPRATLALRIQHGGRLTVRSLRARSWASAPGPPPAALRSALDGVAADAADDVAAGACVAAAPVPLISLGTADADGSPRAVRRAPEGATARASMLVCRSRPWRRRAPRRRRPMAAARRRAPRAGAAATCCA